MRKDIHSSISAVRDNEDQRLRQQLKEQLADLSFPAFERCVRQLLMEMGYSQVRSLGRRSPRGRTRHGGLDVTACSETGVTRSRLILQVKQYDRPVSRRFVDELRGACLRVGAEQGLVVTTSTFSKAAMTAAAAEPPLPIRLLDGNEVLDLLIRHGIGVRDHRKGRVVDEDYFEALRRIFPAVEKAVSSLRSGQDAIANYRSAIKTPASLVVKEGRKEVEMLWRTHALFGIGSLWLLQPWPELFSAGNVALLVVAATFGALLPDLDAEQSKIRSLQVGNVRPFVPLSSLIFRAWGHRGPLHSVWGLAGTGIVCVLLTAWWGAGLSLALWLGYASHLAADACTRTGIPFLYPNRRRYWLLPPGMRFVTGSAAEDLLFLPLAGLAAALLLSHFFLSPL